MWKEGYRSRAGASKRNAARAAERAEMLNPFKLFAVYSDLNKIEAVTKEKATMKVKVSQVLTLLISLFGTVGVPALAANWLHAHVAIYTGFVVAAILLHAVLPSIFAAPSAADTQATGLNKLGMILLIVGLMAMVPCTARSQTAAPVADVQNMYAAGVSYNAGASPSVAGTGLYARLVANTGTYAFTALDVLPNTLKPLTVNTNVGIGVAQKIATIANIPVYVPTAAGISFNGANTGWQWNVGALASIKLKGNYYLMPTVRLVKSSVSNGTGYQPIAGVLFGWGR